MIDHHSFAKQRSMLLTRDVHTITAVAAKSLVFMALQHFLLCLLALRAALQIFSKRRQHSWWWDARHGFQLGLTIGNGWCDRQQDSFRQSLNRFFGTPLPQEPVESLIPIFIGSLRTIYFQKQNGFVFLVKSAANVKWLISLQKFHFN